MKVISGIYPGVTTVELDTLAAETAATMTTKHPDYAILAARIAVSNLHKETKKLFTCKNHNGFVFVNTIWFINIKAVMEDLHSYVNPKNGLHQPMISDEVYEIIKENGDVRYLLICNLFPFVFLET